MVALAWLLGLFGAIWGVYTYYAAEEKPGLTYFVHPAKAAVVRTGQTSRLSVVFDGKELTGNVTATQVAIWNAGKKPIRQDSVLRPLVISTADGSRILEARVQKVSREVAGFSMDATSAAAGKVTLSWTIMEEGDGAVVQIVYAAGDETDVKAEAVLVGQPEIARETFSPTGDRSPAEEYDRKVNWKTYAGLAFALFMLTMMAVIEVSETRASGRPWTRYRIAKLIVLPIAFLIGVYIALRPPPGPPFGF